MATTTYEPIATQTLGSASATVTFSSILQTYTDLILVCSLRKSTSNGGYIAYQFNGDTASNYSSTFLYGTGSSAVSGRVSNETFGRFGNGGTGNFETTILNIQNYSNATTNKTTISRSNVVTLYTLSYCTLWRKAPEAITSITLFPDTGNFDSGSTFTLYGIANADIGAKATGGVITYDDTYFYHTFGASGTFTPKQSLTVDYLVAAGGGAGGGWSGAGGGGASGGGGAGGVICTVGSTGGLGTLPSALSLTAQAYTITIGAGGATGNGSDSSISGSGLTTITATGGGRGATRTTNNASIGGSGGGGYGAGDNNPGAAGTSGQGFAGGNGSGTDGGSSGGGGGAGAIGQTGFRDGSAGDWFAGDGGIGIQTSINGTLTYYGGGGGGGSGDTADGWLPIPNGAGAGGLGGGGRGSQANPNGQTPQAGSVNTGGGGGGRDNSGSYNGLNGGSGVVIIRYPKA